MVAQAGAEGAAVGAGVGARGAVGVGRRRGGGHPTGPVLVLAAVVLAVVASGPRRAQVVGGSPRTLVDGRQPVRVAVARPRRRSHHLVVHFPLLSRSVFHPDSHRDQGGTSLLHTDTRRTARTHWLFRTEHTHTHCTAGAVE